MDSEIEAIRYDAIPKGAKVWKRFYFPKAAQQWYYKTVAAAMEKRFQESAEPLNNFASRLTQTVKEVFVNKDIIKQHFRLKFDR